MRQHAQSRPTEQRPNVVQSRQDARSTMTIMYPELQVGSDAPDLVLVFLHSYPSSVSALSLFSDPMVHVHVDGTAYDPRVSRKLFPRKDLELPEHAPLRMHPVAKLRPKF